MATEPLRIIPLGGLGEIGKNMMVVEYGQDILVIDAGIMFPENDMLGVDAVIPDFSYLMDRLHRVRAIVMTHGHEDHIGALPFVLKHLQVPIYATRLTIGFIESRVRPRERAEAPLRVVRAGERVTEGPFQIEFFHVTHSVPDGVGLAIRTPAGLIVHSGDFKLDYTPVIDPPADLSRLAALGAEGVLVFLSDSTNSENPGFTPSERSVQPAFDAVFSSAPGRVIVATFASHLPRIQQVIWVCQRYGRKLAVAGHSMEEYIKIASELGYLQVPADLVMSISQIKRLPADKVAILATGTQGEPTAALARIAKGSHRQIQIERGDTVIVSAHPIPGNEEEVGDVINRLFQRGADVVYDKIAPVHVSGHASQEEQKLALKLIAPRYFVPIHGELRHLHRHARTANELGIPPERVFVVENGYVLTFDEEGGHIGERVPGGYVFVDGRGVGDIGPAVLRDRELLSQDGFLVLGLRLDHISGALLDEPDIVSRGFVALPAPPEVVEQINDWIRDSLKRQPRYPGRQAMTEILREDLKRQLYEHARRRPIIVPIITEL
jgi:ribonuclease J